MEWAALLHLLNSVSLNGTKDIWYWPLHSSKKFTVCSLIEGIFCLVGVSKDALHKVIWKGSYPKRPRLLFGSLAMVVCILLIDILQKRLLFFSISQLRSFVHERYFIICCWLRLECCDAREYSWVFLLSFSWVTLSKERENFFRWP